MENSQLITSGVITGWNDMDPEDAVRGEQVAEHGTRRQPRCASHECHNHNDMRVGT